MTSYQKPSKKLWTGRISEEKLYLHEKVACLTIDEIKKSSNKQFALLGYACDEGVRSNLGRVGAKDGPDAIRMQLGKMPNHLSNTTKLHDIGNITCKDVEAAQSDLSEAVSRLLKNGDIPILIGGGHDIAYGHYKGIKAHLKSKKLNLGVINFDAHFDLRDNGNGNNSGTPFFQIAQEENSFHYLCLGIRHDANDSSLFKTAQKLDVKYLLRDAFRIQFVEEINKWINAFLNSVDVVYVTIDLDGFSSAYAPGVSAPSPMGFSPDIVVEALETIINSGKLISLDIAEMNPKYDIDNQTAKLAASLIHKVIHSELS